MATMTFPTMPPSLRFNNAAEWWHALGDVPLERIVMDPWPGTAKEDDLIHLAEHHDRPCELIDGTLVEKAVGFDESVVAVFLITALTNFVRPRKLGIVGGESSMLRMISGTVRIPDVMFINYDRLPGGKLPIGPIKSLNFNLAVEILSESNTSREMQRKMTDYFDAGAELVWIIDPASRTVAVYESLTETPLRTLYATDILEGIPALPGFSMAVAELFSELP